MRITNRPPRSRQKISDQFAARLARYRRGQKLQAILLLESSAKPQLATGLRSIARRVQRLTETRDASTEALRDIDALLTRFNGRRLSDAPSAIGTLPVETTAAGIRALAALPSVKSILEDQPISRIDSPDRVNS